MVCFLSVIGGLSMIIFAYSIFNRKSNLQNKIGKILIDEINIPKNYLPIISKTLFEFYHRLPGESFRYGDLKIEERSISLKVNGKFIEIAEVDWNGVVKYKKQIPIETQRTVSKIIYALGKIMDAELSGAAKKFYSDSKITVDDYQGVKVIRKSDISID